MRHVVAGRARNDEIDQEAVCLEILPQMVGMQPAAVAYVVGYPSDPVCAICK